jgi:hypothetical protein
LWGSRFIFVLCALLVALSVPARASPECKTLAEARAAYPGKHLWFHGPRHCWDATPGRRHFIRHRQAPTTAPEPIKNDRRDPTIVWPTLTQGAGVDAPFLNAAPATAWPLLLDVDALTAEPDPPECCWPAIEDDPPAANFRERWTAMPAAWIMARRP